MTVTLNANEGILYDADGTVVFTASIKGVSVYLNGTGNSTISVNEVKQTGASNLYLADGIALLVAAAGSVVIAKKPSG